MKYFFALVIFVFSNSSLSREKQCWLTTETTQDGNLYVDCRVGPSPYKRLCKVNPRAEGAAFGQVYDVVIVKPVDDSFLGTIEQWLELNSKEWSPGAELKEGEFIRCTINRDRLQQLKAERQAARQAERQARLEEEDRLNKLDQAKRQYCEKENKQALEKILCAEWRMEALSEQ